MEKISIIVPLYNAEKYLDKCLLSIKSQTYENFEAIIINDGSKDNSIGICRKYIKDDNRFILLDQQNRGTGGARNAGLRHATGQYITFLDSDDWYDRDCLEYLLNGIKTCNAEVFYCDFKTDNIQEYCWNRAVFTGEEAMLQLIKGGCCNRVNNKIYKREVLENVYFPEGRDLCEDAAWTAQVLINAKLVSRGDEAKYNVRITRGSLSRQKYVSERTLCGYYRNFLDRCEVFADHYPKDDIEAQNLILAECRNWLERILTSGSNLDKWDVYGTAVRLVRGHSDLIKQGMHPVFDYYWTYNDYKSCVKAYRRDLLLSKDKRLSEKRTFILNNLKSIIRRLKR